MISRRSCSGGRPVFSAYQRRSARQALRTGSINSQRASDRSPGYARRSAMTRKYRRPGVCVQARTENGRSTTTRRRLGMRQAQGTPRPSCHLIRRMRRNHSVRPAETPAPDRKAQVKARITCENDLLVSAVNSFPLPASSEEHGVGERSVDAGRSSKVVLAQLAVGAGGLAGEEPLHRLAQRLISLGGHRRRGHRVPLRRHGGKRHSEGRCRERSRS